MTTLLTLIGFLSLAPAMDRPVPDQSWNVAAYTIETSYERTGEHHFAIVKDGQEVYSKTIGQFWFVAVHPGKESTSLHNPVVADVTGDGVPDLIVEHFPLHSSCCWSYTIISMGKTPKEITTIGDFPSPVTFEDLNHDGKYEIVGDDWNFNSWYAGSRFILRLDKEGEYHLATNLMKRPAPTPAELSAKAAEFRKATVYAGFPVAREVYQYMLDLVYSGNMDSAWAFLDLSWPKGETGKQEFIDRFKDQLTKSRFWTEIAEMSHHS